jgi:glutamyl-tRNA synthetase
MRRVPIEEKMDAVLPYLQQAGLVDATVAPGVREKVGRILAAAGDRVKIAGDIVEYADFFLPDDKLPYEEKAFDKSLRKPGAAGLLARFRDRLGVAEPFDAASLESLMQAFVAEQGIKVAEIIHPVRVAVTGKSVGFGLFDTLAILGKSHSLARIDRALAIVGGTLQDPKFKIENPK